MLYWLIFAWLLTAAACLLGVRYFIHMFQLESYQLDGYIRYMKARGMKKFLPAAIAGLVYAIVPCACFFFAREISAIVAFAAGVICLGFSALYSARLAKESQKKPLVITARVKRLFKYLIAVSVVLSAVCTFLRVPGLAYSLVPAIVYIAGALAAPAEKRINMGFFKEAQAKLDARTDLVKIGITGSYGKTSTKFTLKTILDEKFNVYATPSSYNTPMGVTRVVRENLKPEHEIFLGEMGARHVGDIKEMTELVHPTIGIITSVGPQHLETFHTIENVAATKNELIEALPEDGIGFFAADGAWVDKLYEKATCEKYRAGLDGEDLYMRASDVQVGPEGSSFTLTCADGESILCRTELLGTHNIQNITVCAAVARRLGLSMKEIAHGISRLKCVEHRLQILPSAPGKTVIDDSFNSNPAGAASAMKVLASFSGFRAVITPGMVELGEREEELNHTFGTQLAMACDAAILVGRKRSEPIRKGMLEAGFDPRCIFVADNIEHATKILGALNADVILFENDLPDNYNE